MSPTPARGLCQAGRRFPHHGKQCPPNHRDAQSEAGSTLKTKLTARFFQQGAVGFSKTCHCLRGHGGGGGDSPLTRNKERRCIAVLWGRGQPWTLLCLFPIARAEGSRRAAGRGLWPRRRRSGRRCRSPHGGVGSIAGTPPGARLDPHSHSPPPRETRQLRSPCPLPFRLLTPERTFKVLRASAPPRVKGFACASARRPEYRPPQFLIPAADGVAAEPAGQQGSAEPGQTPPPRHPGRTKARRAPNPRPALAPWYPSQLSTRKENIE